MSVYDLILKRRTIRKFKQQKIDKSILEKLANAARFAPSAANLQPLKYAIVEEKEKVDTVFQHVRWAGYIAPDGTPEESERPVAFIIILLDNRIKKGYYDMDVGAAAQNIMLAAQEEGIGTCWICSVNRDEIKSLFKIPDEFDVSSVIALGYPAESPVVEDENGSIKYYKDESGVLHVPKRRLEDVMLNL